MNEMAREQYEKIKQGITTLDSMVREVRLRPKEWERASHGIHRGGKSTSKETGKGQPS